MGSARPGARRRQAGVEEGAADGLVDHVGPAARLNRRGDILTRIEGLGRAAAAAAARSRRRGPPPAHFRQRTESEPRSSPTPPAAPVTRSVSLAGAVQLGERDVAGTVGDEEARPSSSAMTT